MATNLDDMINLPVLRAAGEVGEACLRISMDSLFSSLAALVRWPRRRVLHKNISQDFYKNYQILTLLLI